MPTESRTETVAVVGGGCSGILVAAHLLTVDRRPRRIVIFEPGTELGAGAAYGTDRAEHLLNAPARFMSAFDDKPDDFVHWLSTGDRRLGPDDFAPRRLYRRYLGDVLRRRAAAAGAGTTVSWVRHSVTDVVVDTTGTRGRATVFWGHAHRRRVDRVVLCVGAPAPGALASIDLPAAATVVRDPWAPGALEVIDPDDDVLIVGTGLTMVDVTLALTAGGHRGRIHARSRRGRMPTVHTDDGFAPWPDFDIGRPARARDVLRRMRSQIAEAEAAGWDWRNVMAAARTVAPEVWAGLPVHERQRLARHGGRYWDVHRHRMSAGVADTLGALRRSGRLTVDAGRVLGAACEGASGDAPGRGSILVTVGTHDSGRHDLRVGALVDCTGPAGDAHRSCPIVARLMARGLARVHPTGLGLDVDEHGGLVGDETGGRPVIHAIGWCRLGASFESTAVPELRSQAARLARHVAAAAPLPRWSPPISPDLGITRPRRTVAVDA